MLAEWKIRKKYKNKNTTQKRPILQVAYTYVYVQLELWHFTDALCVKVRMCRLRIAPRVFAPLFVWAYAVTGCTGSGTWPILSLVGIRPSVLGRSTRCV